MGLAAGLVDREALVAWADKEIVVSADPAHEIIELALCGQRPYSEIIWLLNQFQGDPDYDLGLKLLFARAGVLFEQHPERVHEIAHALHLLNEEGFLPREVREQLNALDGDLEQYRQARISRAELGLKVSGFLSLYAAFRPQLEITLIESRNEETPVITIRPYEQEDAPSVGRLIADTFREFNLSYASPEEQELLLGPFRHAHSTDAEHQAAIVQIIQAPTILVAERDGDVVGVLRGSVGRLHSLFVDKSCHRQGVGRMLMDHFERMCRQEGATAITLASSLYAVSFYARLGYKKSTGVRKGPCFDGRDFPYQPMKKVL